jgi:hypothetical protein
MGEAHIHTIVNTKSCSVVVVVPGKLTTTGPFGPERLVLWLYTPGYKPHKEITRAYFLQLISGSNPPYCFYLPPRSYHFSYLRPTHARGTGGEGSAGASEMVDICSSISSSPDNHLPVRKRPLRITGLNKLSKEGSEPGAPIECDDSD